MDKEQEMAKALSIFEGFESAHSRPGTSILTIRENCSNTIEVQNLANERIGNESSSFSMECQAKFFVPETTTQQFHEAEQKLKFGSETYHMIDAKPELWNSGKYGTPANIILLKYYPTDCCLIIDSFNPVTIPGDPNDR